MLQTDSHLACRAGQMQGLDGADRLVILPIFAALPPEQQAKVFGEAPQGTRKVCGSCFRPTDVACSCLAACFDSADVSGYCLAAFI